MINFEIVAAENIQIVALYDLLTKREHNISNFNTPSFEEHENFVKNNPYRAWYLVKYNNKYIGSIYLLNNNYIGINLLSHIKQATTLAIDLILKNYRPTAEIKSIIPSDFCINVAPNNTELLMELKSLGASKIQETYSLKSLTRKT